jgi:hypothetical protein
MLLGLLSRARGVVRPPPARVAHHAASPLAGDLGGSPFRCVGVAPLAPPPPPLWSEDPASGEPLPQGPGLALAPEAFRAARVAHRHGWFAALAFAAGQGDSAAESRAIAAMDSWIREDIPGSGLAWAHASDLAARLVHWHAGLAWLGDRAPGWLRAALAGSAAWHLEHLRDRLPTGDAVARRVAHHAGRVVGGFTFPAAPDARAARSEGLAGLRFDLPRLMHGDGAPVDDALLALAEPLWYAAIARAVARANGAAFPGDADAAFARGARCLERLAGELGSIPPCGDAPLGDLLATPDPIAWSLWNLARSWGLGDGPAAPKAREDTRLAWLGVPPPEGAADASGKTWSMWVFRESGLAVAHMRIKDRPSRVVAEMGSPARPSVHTQVAPLNLLWDVGATSVLADPGPTGTAGRLATWLRSPGAHNALLLDGHSLGEAVPAELGVARVDGKKARIEGRHTGWHRLRVPLTHARDVLLNQARVIVTDRLVPTRARVGRHAVRLVWQLGPGWEITPDGAGYVGRKDGLNLVIQLPGGLSWSLHTGVDGPEPCGWIVGEEGVVPAPCLVGDGGVDGPAEFVSSFEIR